MRPFIIIFLIFYIYILSTCIGTPPAKSQVYTDGFLLSALSIEKMGDSTELANYYRKALELEHMVFNWAPKWEYEISKTAVKLRLVNFYGFLTGKSHWKNNYEVILLKAILCHYLYNMDYKIYYKKSHDYLLTALKHSNTDYRALWLMGSHQLKSALYKEGKKYLLKAFDYGKTNKVSPYFWKDFSSCSATLGLFSHFQFSVGQMEKSFSPDNSSLKYYQNIITQQFFPPDPDKNYSFKEIFLYKQIGEDIHFLNRAMGFSLALNQKADAIPLELKNRNCGFGIKLGPHPGYQGKVYSSILMLASFPKKEQSLDDYLKNFKNIQGESVKLPIKNNYRAIKTIIPDQYPEQGGGRTYTVVLENPEPEYPGIAIERPFAIEKLGDDSGETQYFKITPGFSRIKGPVYFYFFLDTCRAVEDMTTEIFFDLIIKRFKTD